jgi:hypothetical protein
MRRRASAKVPGGVTVTLRVHSSRIPGSEWAMVKTISVSTPAAGRLAAGSTRLRRPLCRRAKDHGHRGGPHLPSAAPPTSGQRQRGTAAAAAGAAAGAAAAAAAAAVASPSRIGGIVGGSFVPLLLLVLWLSGAFGAKCPSRRCALLLQRRPPRERRQRGTEEE